MELVDRRHYDTEHENSDVEAVVQPGISTLDYTCDGNTASRG